MCNVVQGTVTNRGRIGVPLESRLCTRLIQDTLGGRLTVVPSMTSQLSPGQRGCSLLLLSKTGSLNVAIKARFDRHFFPLTVYVFSSTCEQSQVVLLMVPAFSDRPQTQYLSTPSGLTLLLAGGCLLQKSLTLEESCMG